MLSNPTQPDPPDDSSPDPLDGVRELISRHMDGDLTGSESASLSQSKAADNAPLGDYERLCRQISQELRAIPITPVAPSFRDAVMSAVRDHLGTDDESGEIWPIQTGNHRTLPVSGEQSSTILNGTDRPTADKTSRRLPWTAFISLASIAAAVIAVLVLQHDSVREVSDRTVAEVSPALAATSVRDADRGLTTDIASTAKSGTSEEASEVPVLSSPTDWADELDRRQHEMVQSQAVNWEIVVVHLASQDRADAMRRIEQVAAAHGLQMPAGTRVASQSTGPFGVLLTSATVAPDQFVAELQQQGLTEDEQINPPRAAEMPREELISRIRTAMSSPTLSELHFGEVYVAMPRLDETYGTAYAGRENSRNEPGTPHRSYSATDAVNPLASSSPSGLAASDASGGEPAFGGFGGSRDVTVRPGAVAAGEAGAGAHSSDRPATAETTDEAGSANLAAPDRVILVIFEFDPGHALLENGLLPVTL